MTGYTRAYDELFTGEFGPRTLSVVANFARTHDGEFTAAQAIDAAVTATGMVDGWHALCALDHLVTLGELRELTAGTKCWGQERRYIRA